MVASPPVPSIPQAYEKAQFLATTADIRTGDDSLFRGAEITRSNSPPAKD